MVWFEEEVSWLERSVLPRVNGNRPPVFYGSSSFRLWTSLAEDFDPAVVNLGFGGSTLEACRHFFSRLIPPVRPRSILLYAGDNDVADGRRPEDAAADFRQIADQVLRSLGPIPLGFVSVKLSPARFSLAARIQDLNQRIQREIESRTSCYYVDVFSPMLDESGRPRPDLFSPDGLHLSRQGYRLWGSLLSAHRDRILTASLPS